MIAVPFNSENTSMGARNRFIVHLLAADQD
jgi:hypothetical protein